MSSDTMQAMLLEKTGEGAGLVLRQVARKQPGPGERR
jgi:hypothetical protein